MSSLKVIDETVKSSSDPEDVTSVKGAEWRNRLLGRVTDLNEVGKEYFQQSLQYDQAQLERDSVKVRRKLDFYVLPIVISSPHLQAQSPVFDN